MAVNCEGGGRRRTTVVIVDDHPMLAAGLAEGLRRADFDAHIVEELSADAIVESVRRVDADIVLLDLLLGDEVGDALPFIGPLADTGAQVFMLTGVTDERLLGACLEAGASGVVRKASSLEAVVDQLGRAAEGSDASSHAEREDLLGTLRRHRVEERARLAPFDRLTPREGSVLGALMGGASPQSIADDSGVSVATVRSQIRSILEKLGVHSQVAAVALAHRSGWAAPD